MAKSADPAFIFLRIRALLRHSPAVEGATAEPRKAGGAASATPTFTAFRRARLLLVDDSATTRLHLARLLEASGYTVEVASGPDEGHPLLARRLGWRLEEDEDTGEHHLTPV